MSHVKMLEFIERLLLLGSVGVHCIECSFEIGP